MDQDSTIRHPLRVVLIDGKPLDACLLRGRLRQLRAGAVSVTHRASLERGLCSLEQDRYDLALLDPSSLMRTGRADAVGAVVAAAHPAPVVILAARHDSVIAGRYFRLGVQDFVIKGEIDDMDLERVLQHALERQRVVSELEDARRKAEHCATHDALTGLPGRTLFLDRARTAVAAAERHGGSVGLLFIDLDDFKHVNDKLGHDAGDQLLVGVAERLASGIRACDTVARFGGDEFVVLGGQLEHPEDARKMAAALEAKLVRAIPLGRYKKQAKISVGIATYPADGTDVDTLLRKADQAMYRAKRARGRQPRTSKRRALPARPMHSGPLFARHGDA